MFQDPAPGVRIGYVRDRHANVAGQLGWQHLGAIQRGCQLPPRREVGVGRLHHHGVGLHRQDPHLQGLVRGGLAGFHTIYLYAIDLVGEVCQGAVDLQGFRSHQGGEVSGADRSIRRRNRSAATQAERY